MDKLARTEFRDRTNDVKWNRERFHPYKRRPQEQVSAHKTQVVGEFLAEWAVNRAEDQGHFNQDLQRLQPLYDQATTRLNDALLAQATGAANVPTPAQLAAFENIQENVCEEIDKIESKRDHAIAANLKVGMALYCQKHGLAEARKVADALYWRTVFLLGVEATNRILEKLFDDILKAGVEGKLGMGSY